MLHSLHGLFAPALAERLTLALNHVLRSEPAATRRLAAHAGRSVELRLDHWPALLPPPPVLAFHITPAGLLEWRGDDRAAVPDLGLVVDARNPAALVGRAFTGERPVVQIEGDAALAGDVDWLLQNLRWDVTADLERLVGPLQAQQLQRIGSAIAGGLHSALGAAGRLGRTLRPGPR